MTFPWTLPDWLPWWALTLVVVPVLVYLLLFALMPFSVFGVKDRLDAIEARLDEIQGEIRQLTLRLADPGPPAPDQMYVAPARPPIPPRPAESAWRPDPEEQLPPDRPPPRRAAERPTSDRPTSERPSRSEPRLDWPR